MSDIHSQRLGEWLHTLGCPVALTQTDLRYLNTPRMRSIWRHLQGHVFPIYTADIIRGNALLNTINEGNSNNCQLENVKVCSVDQLLKAKEVNETKDKIEKLRNEIKQLDDKLESIGYNILMKTAEKKNKIYELNEIEDKITILSLKLNKIKKSSKDLSSKIETAHSLKNAKFFSSNQNLHQQMTTVCKYAKNYKFQLSETDDGYLEEMVCNTLGFKCEAILNAVLSLSSQALKALNNSRLSLLQKEKHSSDEIVSFTDHFKELKACVVNSALTIHDCKNKITSESQALQKEKAELLITCLNTDLNEGCGTSDDTDSTDELGLEELLDIVLKNTGLSAKNNKLKDCINRLNKECKELTNLSELNSLAERDKKLWFDVEKKVSEINEAVKLIYRVSVDSDYLHKFKMDVSEIAREFLIDVRQNHNKKISSEFIKLTAKEMEIFQKSPTVVLTRKWETENEILPVDTLNKCLGNTLFHLIIHSEYKNIITYILGKKCWSLTLNSKFCQEILNSSH